MGQVKRLYEKHEERSLMMMKTPKGWPLWPRLPVKRYKKNTVTGGTNTELGIMFASDYQYGAKPEVLIMNLFDKPDEKTPIKKYRDLEAVCADSWIVD